jgi:formate dehydrogenase subunit delta
MNVEHLVSMANDIAAFFDSESDKAVAAEGVRFHISRYWELRMRRAIIEHLQNGGAGLTPTARSAIEKLAPTARSAGGQ